MSAKHAGSFNRLLLSLQEEGVWKAGENWIELWCDQMIELVPAQTGKSSMEWDIEI